jgi:CRISPR/Cas system-associated protein Cas10 (large subunit of type III CRISPR-Cas system)
MKGWLREMPELELALLRRSVGAMAAGNERCEHCHRTPLVGERVYLYDSGEMLCELCRALRRDSPAASRLVHSPELGNAVRIRITDRRTAV